MGHLQWSRDDYKGFKGSPVKFTLLLFSEKFNWAGKDSSDPPQNRRIKMLKNYKELEFRQKSYYGCMSHALIEGI